jgi:hypothetical protein
MFTFLYGIFFSLVFSFFSAKPSFWVAYGLWRQNDLRFGSGINHFGSKIPSMDTKQVVEKQSDIRQFFSVRYYLIISESVPTWSQTYPPLKANFFPSAYVALFCTYIEETFVVVAYRILCFRFLRVADFSAGNFLRRKALA